MLGIGSLAIVFFAALFVQSTPVDYANAKWKVDRRVERAFTRASKLYAAGQYAKALPLAHKAADLARKRLGTSHSRTAWIVNLVGTLYDILGQYQDVFAALGSTLSSRCGSHTRPGRQAQEFKPKKNTQPAM